MQDRKAVNHTKWVLYTWPDATFSAIEVPQQWRYTQQVPTSALLAHRYQNSYEALDVLLRRLSKPGRPISASGRGRTHHAD